MATAIPAIRSELHSILPWVVPVISTCSANGATSYLVDTAVWTDASSVGLTTKSVNRMYIYNPEASAAGDRSRIANGNSGAALDLTNARIYPGVAWANAPQSGDRYEIWAIPPKTALDLLVDTMNNFRQADLMPIANENDEDMEASGTTGYGVDGAGSLSKSSTYVDKGTQALLFDAGTAGETLTGPSYGVTPNTTYYLPSTFLVVGGPGIFAIYDNTNSAEIESGNRVSHSIPSFMQASRTFTTPAGCYSISPQWIVTNSTDDIYIDRFQAPRTAQDKTIEAASTMDRSVDIRKIMVAEYRRGINGDAGTVYDVKSRVFTHDLIKGKDWTARINPHHDNPNHIEFSPYAYVPMQELWVECLRKASDITAWAYTAAGESSPTSALPARLLALDWAVRICDYVLSYRPEDEEATISLRRLTRTDPRTQKRMPDGEYANLLKDYTGSLETASYPPRHPLVNMAGV